MNIRPYQPSDLEDLVALFAESIHALAGRYYDSAQRAAWAPASPNLNEWRLRLERVITLVSEIDHRLAGFISFEADGHIDLLYTSPHMAREGVATALYREAESHLAAAGITELFTEASLVAAPFFETQGFEIVEEQLVERQGITFRRYAMRKRLTGCLR